MPGIHQDARQDSSFLQELTAGDFAGAYTPACAQKGVSCEFKSRTVIEYSEI